MKVSEEATVFLKEAFGKARLQVNAEFKDFQERVTIDINNAEALLERRDTVLYNEGVLKGFETTMNALAAAIAEKTKTESKLIHPGSGIIQ